MVFSGPLWDWEFHFLVGMGRHQQGDVGWVCRGVAEQIFTCTSSTLTDSNAHLCAFFQPAVLEHCLSYLDWKMVPPPPAADPGQDIVPPPHQIELCH